MMNQNTEHKEYDMWIVGVGIVRILLARLLGSQHKNVFAYGDQLANSFETTDLFINSLNLKVQTSNRKLSILNNI